MWAIPSSPCTCFWLLPVSASSNLESSYETWEHLCKETTSITLVAVTEYQLEGRKHWLQLTVRKFRSARRGKGSDRRMRQLVTLCLQPGSREAGMLVLTRLCVFSSVQDPSLGDDTGHIQCGSFFFHWTVLRTLSIDAPRSVLSWSSKSNQVEKETNHLINRTSPY